MTVQTTSNLSNSIRTQYIADYLDRIYGQRLYDQIAAPIGGISPEQAIQGSTVQVDYLSSMALGTSTISQTADMTPQILYDTTASTSVTSRGEALQWSENLDIQVYTDYAMRRIAKIADNALESIEVIANAAATQGTFVERAAARASLDAGTASHRASDAFFRKMHGQMLAQKVPGFINEQGEANVWAAIMHPKVFHDISESGNVDAIGTYQEKGIHLNFELAQIGPFRLVVSPNAKVFFGAASANANTFVTDLATATSPLNTAFTLTDTPTNATACFNVPFTVGTIETGDTHYPTNEQIVISSAVTDTVCDVFVGTGENGGLRFARTTSDTVVNHDSAYTIVLGGPASIYKLYAPSVGEFGAVVGPKTSGLAEQFSSVAWKWYGNYGRLTENLLLRGEFSTSYEA
jgi:hypothetical protein